MANSEILMICLTAVIAAAGVIGACIFNNQLSVMQGQLDEMKSTGKQNEILIETNKTLANAAKIAAEAARQSADAIANLEDLTSLSSQNHRRSRQKMGQQN